jgi:hypothetical protein
MLRVVRVVAAGLVAAVLLAACGTTAPKALVLNGTPTLSISVPLSLAGCGPSGHCYALGTTGLDNAPDVSAQTTTLGHHWHKVATPVAPSTVLQSWSCWIGGCLFGGSDPSGDVVWATTGSNSLAAVSEPAGGAAVASISCYASASCSLVDVGDAGTVRYTTTTSGGSSWSTPIGVAWPSGSRADSLTCTSSTVCVVGGSYGPARALHAEWATTTDAGQTWAANSSSQFHSLSDLACFARKCEGLASLGRTSEVVVSSDGGTTWSAYAHQPPKSPSDLSCSAYTACAVIATSPQDEMWMSLERGHTWTTPQLQYAPGPAVSVGCGADRCVAISPTVTVVATIPAA